MILHRISIENDHILADLVHGLLTTQIFSLHILELYFDPQNMFNTYYFGVLPDRIRINIFSVEFCGQTFDSSKFIWPNPRFLEIHRHLIKIHQNPKVLAGPSIRRRETSIFRTRFLETQTTYAKSVWQDTGNAPKHDINRFGTVFVQWDP